MSEQSEVLKKKIKNLEGALVLTIGTALIGLFFIAETLYNMEHDIFRPAFNQLEVFSGTIKDVYDTSGKAPVPTVVLETPEKLMYFRHRPKNREVLQGLIGKKVTLWGARYYDYFGMLEITGVLYQVEHGNDLIIDYKEVTKVWHKYPAGFNNFLNWVFIVFLTLVLVFPSVYYSIKGIEKLKEVRGEYYGSN